MCGRNGGSGRTRRLTTMLAAGATAHSQPTYSGLVEFGKIYYIKWSIRDVAAAQFCPPTSICGPRGARCHHSLLACCRCRQHGRTAAAAGLLAACTLEHHIIAPVDHPGAPWPRLPLAGTCRAGICTRSRMVRLCPHAPRCIDRSSSGCRSARRRSIRHQHPPPPPLPLPAAVTARACHSCCFAGRCGGSAEAGDEATVRGCDGGAVSFRQGNGRPEGMSSGAVLLPGAVLPLADPASCAPAASQRLGAVQHLPTLNGQ